MDRLRGIGRWAVWALPVWALMLLLGTLTHQPDPQTDMAGFSAYVTTSSFLLSHLLNSILGAAIGSVGVLGLLIVLADTRAARLGAVGAMTTVVGNSVTTAVFGAAAFAQPAIGHLFLRRGGDALALYNDVYSAPLFATAVAGLLFFIVGGICVGVAVIRSGALPRWAGYAYAVAAPSFVLSNFLLPAGQPVAAAALVVSTLGLAVSVARRHAA